LLSAGLTDLLPEALEFVPAGRFAAFVVDCEPAWDQQWKCRLLDARGEAELAAHIADPGGMAAKLASPIERSIVVSSLLELENPSARIRLEMRVRGRTGPTARKIGSRGLAIVADASPHRMHVRRPGEARTTRNSLQLELRPSEDCYLTLVHVDSEGSLLQAFPNRYQRSDFLPQGRVQGGQTVSIPDSLQAGNQAGFHLDYAPPAGEDTVRAFCMTQFGDAVRLREQIERLAERTTDRGTSSAGTGPLFSQLAANLSDTAVRGLVIVDDTVQEPQAAPGQVPPDWTAASVTIEVGE
jgi:hypothetical protein